MAVVSAGLLRGKSWSKLILSVNGTLSYSPGVRWYKGALAVMGEYPIKFLIAIAVGLGALAAIAYYIVRFARGAIELSLPTKAYDPGDTISGSFDLHTKRAMQGNKLVVSLIAVQETKIYEDEQTRTRVQEVYRDEVLVEEARTYAAGFSASYDFEISAPNAQSPEILNSSVGQALTAAVRALSDRSTRLKWKIEARLDAKGVDLATSEKVQINQKHLF